MLTMSLPFETLSHIFAFLPNSSLKTLRLACRRFYDIATPRLFRSIFVSAHHLDREIAELVATRFLNSIHTLTFSAESYYNMALSDFVSHLKRVSSRCGNPTLHLKKRDIWELYCKIGSERQALYESGAVHAQLCHLLNTLPNLRQIVITDRRRRQDLSWLQEAFMCRKIQRLSPLEIRVSPMSEIRRSLGDLHSLCKGTTSDKKLSDILTRFRTILMGKDAKALAQLQTVQHVSCACYDKIDKDPLSLQRFSGLHDAGTQWMPQTPWAMIMTALSKSPTASIHTISLQPKDPKSRLPIPALTNCGPDILLATSTVLARLTVLKLNLTYSTINLASEMRQAKGPTKMLSAACNLQSLSINIMNDHGHPRGGNTFELLLAGCKLPHLSTLHLDNFTFRENDFAVFLQHSPNIRDLYLGVFYMVYADPQAWERIFQTMKDTLPRLVHFDLSDRQRLDTALEDNRLWEDRMHFRFNDMAQRFFFYDGINPFADIAALSVTEDYWTRTSRCGWCEIGGCITHV